LNKTSKYDVVPYTTRDFSTGDMATDPGLQFRWSPQDHESALERFPTNNAKEAISHASLLETRASLGAQKIQYTTGLGVVSMHSSMSCTKTAMTGSHMFIEYLYNAVIDTEDSNDDLFFPEDVAAVSNLGSLFTDASACENLDFFHTTVQYMQINDNFWNTNLPACGITSISFAMEDDQGIEFEWMPQVRDLIKETPTFRFLELRDWQMTDCPWGLDQDFDEPGTWNITHLSVLDCGPVVDDMLYVFKMPKDLQSLKITSHLAPDYKRHGMDNPISIQKPSLSLTRSRIILWSLSSIQDPASIGCIQDWASDNFPNRWSLVKLIHLHSTQSCNVSESRWR
ncbi:unnamed protein product, partial [Aureobasidium vineae]